MNGFRTELINKIVGFNPHITVDPYQNEINLDQIDSNKSKISALSLKTPAMIFELSSGCWNKEHTILSFELVN